MKKISIEDFKKEIKNQTVIFTVEAYNKPTSNLLSPIRCKLVFSNINVNTIDPAFIKMEKDGEYVRISQIKEIYKKSIFKDNVKNSVSYMVTSGSLECTNKVYTLTCI